MRHRLQAISYKLQAHSGFTLVELIVSMGLFVLITTVGLTIYTSTIRAQRFAVASNRLQRDMQIAMEIMTKSIRSSSVDYRSSGYYGGTVDPLGEGEDVLALIDRDQVETWFRMENDAVAVQQESSGTYLPITSSAIVVQGLKFYITPSTDPFTDLSELPLEQPKVTIVLTGAPKGNPNAPLTVQQTLPQRSGGY